jgi:hypothetical protein
MERRVVDGEHHRRILRTQDAKILARGGVTGERDDAHVGPCEAGALDTLIDLEADGLVFLRPSIHL